MHDGITLTLAWIIGLDCLLVYFSGGEGGGPEVGGGYTLLEDHVSSTLNSLINSLNGTEITFEH